MIITAEINQIFDDNLKELKKQYFYRVRYLRELDNIAIIRQNNAQIEDYISNILRGDDAGLILRVLKRLEEDIGECCGRYIFEANIRLLEQASFYKRLVNTIESKLQKWEVTA